MRISSNLARNFITLETYVNNFALSVVAVPRSLGPVSKRRVYMYLSYGPTCFGSTQPALTCFLKFFGGRFKYETRHH
jgi:hypothetical protein